MFGLFEIDIKKLLLIILILALPLISLNLEHRDADELNWYDYPLIWVVQPTQAFFSNLALGISDTTAHYLHLLKVKKENRLLKEEVASLKQTLKLKEETTIENDRLKKLLEFKQAHPAKLMAAQVTATGIWSEYSSITINKGSEDGIKKKMGVINREGVIGYVVHTQPHYSIVIVLTDKNAVVDSVIQKNRARGIVEGRGRDLCQIKYLLRTDDAQPGDLVVTSGLDETFPKGFPIGSITKVAKRLFGVTQYVEVRPIVDITRVEEVLVVTKNE